MLRLRGQSGVAMITVLFVGAVLTVVASTAAFITVREFRAGSDDRRASQAHSYAEAGIDRMLMYMRDPKFGWRDVVMAGCGNFPVVSIDGVVGFGTFQTTLRRQGACPNEVPSPKVAQKVRIRSRGQHPTASRILEQAVEVQSLGLPIGLFSQRVDANGAGTATNISLITNESINGREKLSFLGIDPYYEREDFYPCPAFGTRCVPADNDSKGDMPAAAHSGQRIFYRQGGLNREEHPSSPNCTANGIREGAPANQSVWDGSISGTEFTATQGSACGWVDPITGTVGGSPPTARFSSRDADRLAPTPALSEEDYQYFRDVARGTGLYCFISGTTRNCTLKGNPITIVNNVINQTDIAGADLKFVAYFDFAPGTDPFNVANTIIWRASHGPCTNDPATNRSGILIVRNGSISMEGGSSLTGAIIAEDGAFDSKGNFSVEGTVIAKEIRVRGSANFKLTQCWVDNLPGPFFGVTPARWSERDR